MNTHGPAFNAVHVSALWVHLGRLARKHRAERVWQERNEVRIIQARDLTLRLLPTLGPRQLANAAHGAAASGVQNLPSWSTFWDRFGSASVRLLRDFKMNELKNVLWAFATAEEHSERFSATIMRSTSFCSIPSSDTRSTNTFGASIVKSPTRRCSIGHFISAQ